MYIFAKVRLLTVLNAIIQYFILKRNGKRQNSVILSDRFAYVKYKNICLNVILQLHFGGTENRMKQKYTVTIAGMTVNLVSDEQEEYVNGLVRLLDQRINEMVVSSKHCSKNEAVLFCAIDYFDDKIKNSLRFQRMQENIDKLTAENAELRARLGIPAEEASENADDSSEMSDKTVEN